MHTVTKITNVDVSTFDEIYNGDKERISTAIGYDDLDRLRAFFTQEDGDYIFQVTDSSNQIMAYIMGEPNMQDGIIRIVHMITRSSDTIANFVEPSANLMKSLGFSEVHFCVKVGGSSYNFCRNNLNRNDIYSHIGETIHTEDGYTDIKLNIL